MRAPSLRAFIRLKYLVYCLLMLNVYFFLKEEMATLAHTYGSGIALGQIFQVFSSTIDTAAWVLLLLLFELETCVIDDARLRGGLKFSLHAVRGLCSLTIIYAFTGYYAELVALYDIRELSGWDGCGRVAEGWSLLMGLDQYEALSPANCDRLSAGAFRIGDFQVVASAEMLQKARGLAWTDVLNAGAWILVVIVLEIEVRLQLAGRLNDAMMKPFRYVKLVLYSVLALALLYWMLAGKFIDFWDASLWLFAFVFIELNVFDWQRETQATQGAVA